MDNEASITVMNWLERKKRWTHRRYQRTIIEQTLQKELLKQQNTTSSQEWQEQIKIIQLESGTGVWHNHKEH